MAYPTNTPPPGSYGTFTILGASETAELFPQLSGYNSAVMSKGGYYYELADSPSPGSPLNVVRVLADPNVKAYGPAVQIQVMYQEASPYATPTPLLGNGDLTQGSVIDGEITGTVEGGGVSTAGATARAEEPLKVPSEGMPRWIWFLALALLVAIVLKDE